MAEIDYSGRSMLLLADNLSFDSSQKRGVVWRAVRQNVAWMLDITVNYILLEILRKDYKNKKRGRFCFIDKPR
jgi:hypothetical protein